VAAAALVLLAGCTHRPSAPPLQNDPVYQNAQAGFRFLVPEGWTQQARAEIPPGRIDKERLLVRYSRPSGAKVAALEASLADLPPSTDLVQFQAAASFGSKKWQPAGPPEQVEVGRRPGVRLNFTSTVDGEDTTKEVVAFRRGDRVFFFTGVFPTADTGARDEVRRAVGSVIWKK
jgi:hypothetical protein